MGWSGTKDGALLQRAAESFDVLLTTDRNLAFQQNLTAVHIGIVVMHAPSNDITVLRRIVPAVLETLLQIKAGEVVRVYPYP
jgi:hypothetical protein